MLWEEAAKPEGLTEVVAAVVMPDSDRHLPRPEDSRAVERLFAAPRSICFGPSK